MMAMSNYSKPQPGSPPEDPLLGTLSRLLTVIAEEFARTAEYVVEIGERLSHGAAERDQVNSHDLQAFDIFAQTARSQASLLKRLAGTETAGAAGAIASMIEDVPFAHIRQRLHQALSLEGENAPIEEEMDDSRVTWF
jgi:hypothetical protein